MKYETHVFKTSVAMVSQRRWAGSIVYLSNYFQRNVQFSSGFKTVLAFHLQRLAAQHHSSSAAARSPLACSSPPRLLTEQSVSGSRLPRVARCTSSASRNSGSAAARSPLEYNSAPRLLTLVGGLFKR